MKFLRPCPLFGILLVCAATTNAFSASYYLQTNMTSGNGQTIGQSAVWFSNVSGGGSNPATFDGHTFHTNGFDARTGTATATFGNAATILNLDDSLGIRTLSTNVTTLPNLVTSGVNARVNSGADGIANIVVNNFTNNANTLLDSANAARTLNLSIGTLSGAADLTIRGGGTLSLTISNASSYTGDFVWATDLTGTILNFENDVTSGGGLIAVNTSRITLDQNVTFASISLNGTSLAPGTYSYAYLNSTFDAIFTNGGSGSMTVVPEPGSLALLGMALFVFGQRSFRRKGF